MKILHVIPYYGWEYGGPVRVVHELSRKLSNLGHQVTVFTTEVRKSSHQKNSRPDAATSRQVEVRYFRTFGHSFANRYGICISLSMMKALASDVGRYDIVHVHEWRGIPNICVWRYSTKNHVPYVLQGHGSSPPCLPGQDALTVLLKSAYDRVIGARIGHDAGKIIALNKVEAGQYASIGIMGERIAIIPNAIDATEYGRMPERGFLRNRLGFSEEHILILSIGRINVTKGLDILVSAFSMVLEQKPQSRLIIVGPDDGFLKELMEIIETSPARDAITYMDPIYGDEKTMALVDADVVVLPSRYETFPITVLEAAACGTPVVVSRNCGIADIVDARFGRVADLTAISTAQEILRIVSDRDLSDSISESARATTLSEYDWEAIARKYERLYDSLIRSRRV